jgi:hypothetical protein
MQVSKQFRIIVSHHPFKSRVQVDTIISLEQRPEIDQPIDNNYRTTREQVRITTRTSGSIRRTSRNSLVVWQPATRARMLNHQLAL